MPDASDLRIAPLSVRKHSSKYVIMLQVLMPPTANDGAQLVSLRYTINVSFVVQLADKMLLAGFGVTGYPSYYDQACQAVSHATRPGAGVSLAKCARQGKVPCHLSDARAPPFRSHVHHESPARRSYHCIELPHLARTSKVVQRIAPAGDSAGVRAREHINTRESILPPRALARE